jgi:hypothetical protein
MFYFFPPSPAFHPRTYFFPSSPMLPSPPPSCTPISPSMEVVSDDEIDEPERVEEGGAIPIEIGIDLSSQSTSSCVPAPPVGHGSSLLLRANLP